MAVCEFCKAEMTNDSVVTCTGNATVEFPDGTSTPSVAYNGYLMNRTPADMRALYPRDPDFAADYPPRDKCRDCGIRPGGFHHPGCDSERCPRCGGQLISCGCLDEEDDDG